MKPILDPRLVLYFCTLQNPHALCTLRLLAEREELSIKLAAVLQIPPETAIEVAARLNSELENQNRFLRLWLDHAAKGEPYGPAETK